MDELNEALNILEKREKVITVPEETVNTNTAVTEQEAAKMIWDICKLSPEHGNAIMDLLGDKTYCKIMRIAAGNKK